MAKRLVILVSLLLLAAGCAGGSGGDAGSSTGDSSDASGDTTETNATTGETGGTTEVSETTGAVGGGTTAETSQAGDVRIEQLSSGAMGPERRQILIASSARDLAAATRAEIPDSGEGTYVAVSWGDKSTGGYTVDFGSASVEGVQVTINVELKPPPEDAMVAQALTYPYAAAVLRGVDAGEKEFVFVTQNGREIGWPVRNV
jgi:hypothetical protein